MWLWTLVAIVFIVWLVAMLLSFTLGGFIHILLALAIILILIQLSRGGTTGQQKT